MEFTYQEQADIHIMFGKAFGNCVEARRLYEEAFPNRQVPHRTVFTREDRNLRETGTFQRQEVSGRPRNARTLALEERVLDRIEEDPSLSTLIIANQEGSSQSTVWRILHEMLLYPYHIQRVRALEERDFHPRVEFCNWLEETRVAVENFEKKILFTDEAGFTRNGIFNFHYNHMWTDENTHATVQKAHQQQFSLNVWAGIIDGHLIGPVFMPQRLNGQIYRIFLQNELPQMLEDLPLLLRAQMWLMHDILALPLEKI